MSFNKAKILKSAEKYVQQGKIAPAIDEYRKIVDADPNDLTMINTLGDLCVRAGRTEDRLGRRRNHRRRPGPPVTSTLATRATHPRKSADTFCAPYPSRVSTRAQHTEEQRKTAKRRKDVEYSRIPSTI